MQPRVGDSDDDAHFTELDPDVDDLDALDALDDYDEYDDEPRSRPGLLEPAPLSLAGLIIACVSFLSNAPLDNAIDSHLLASDSATRLAEFAERAAVSRMVIAVVGLVLCGMAAFFDDETDPAWGRVAARAGIVVAAVSLVVYLAAIVLGASAPTVNG